MKNTYDNGDADIGVENGPKVGQKVEEWLIAEIEVVGGVGNDGTKAEGGELELRSFRRCAVPGGGTTKSS